MKGNSIQSEPTIISLDSVTFQLQEPHNFDWLHDLGKVFCVFDQQDSGNICFGLEKDGNKRFVKYAGARPIDFHGSPQNAVKRLIEAIHVYSTLEHRYLIQLKDHFSLATGYATIFDWVEGECLHSHWSFGGEAKYTNSKSPFYRFKRLPINKRLDSLDAIYSFHSYVEAKGYVAVDFYDGSILYDFANDLTTICDIDFYRKSPSTNEIGEHFWGATRTKAPEEFTYGSPIDSKTNVFTMGAIAFGLLGGEMDHSFEKWQASPKLYKIALQAVNKDRERRYKNIDEFKTTWDKARNE